MDLSIVLCFPWTFFADFLHGIDPTKSKQKATMLTDFYGFSTPVTHTQVLIEINFQAPKTL